MAALSDVVLDDEATGRFPPLIEAETAQPDGKTQWLDTDPLESDRHLGSTDANMAENEAPVLHSTDANPPGNKTQWLDTEDSKPLWNKAQWQGAVRSESMENGPRWSDSVTYKPPNKLQWQNVAKREIETWLTSSSPGEPGNKAQWRDADGDKTKDRNEVDATTAKPKKQYSSKQSTTKSNECFSSEPILMKLPKVTFSQ